MTIEPLLFEHLISNYLWSAVKDWIVDRTPSAFDFVIEKDDGRKVALEALSLPPSARKLAQLSKILSRSTAELAEFVLVTPEVPSSSALKRFEAALSNLPMANRWVGINELPSVLGLETKGDLLASSTIAQLQVQSLVKNLAAYTHAPIGALPRAPGARDVSTQLNAETVSLSRQLPFGAIQSLLVQPGDLATKLRFGQKIDNVTIILSDLKNFSSLVSASRSEDLNEMMARYYRQVRDAVFKHGGMLDKFIGDAVLAVFGYPQPTPQGAVNALRFSHDLIIIGQSILDEWQAEINAVIETGTRVGVATGDIWPLNIGREEIEITLLGDTINLAARLEKNSRVNGILLDNRARTKAAVFDAAFIGGLKLAERQIDPTDAKGQAHPIRAWQIPPSVRE